MTDIWAVVLQMLVGGGVIFGVVLLIGIATRHR